MKKIIITGGATRIGAAIAKKLSGSNIEIVIHYNKSRAKAEKLKKELSKNNTKVYLVKGDLSVEKDVNKILKFAKSKLKYFDCLINNASLFENDKLENFTTDSWGRHLRTNLRTPALLSKAFAKNIRGKKADTVIRDLSFARQRVAHDIKKTVQSAIANAENNNQYDIDNLYVKEAYVGKSLVLKRFRARAKGRASGIKKPFTNLTIILSEGKAKKEETHGSKG